MKRRAARVLLVLVLAGLAAAATYQTIARSRALETTADRRAALAAAAARADVALVELAASQRGYVAPGQGVDFWTVKADEALVSARGELARLGADATDAAASAQAAAVLARLDDFTVVDERARAYARSGQRAVASELIFADGYEILAAARAELASAASLAETASAAPAARDRQVRLAAISALSGIAALGLLLLLRAPRQPEPAAAPSVHHADSPPDARADVDDNIGAALDASLEGLDDFAPAPPAPPMDPVEPVGSVERSRPSVTSVADLCVDLGRLLDARDLEALLARAAAALGARGLVVWIADETGHAISPALTHGYPSSLVARLGPLASDDDNVTVAAWRARSTQVVDGALAVPLLTHDGCTGVLAIEFRDGGEQGADTQALARIIAAQLAATISPTTTESRRATGG